MPNLLTLLPLITLFALISLVNTKKRFLICLLNLEIITLRIIIFTLLSTIIIASVEGLNSLILLTLSACEARLGLACLVKILRSQGNDNLKSINTIKC